MQMVILSGGLAKRLGPLTKDVPKCMLCVNGKTFLEYQIDLLKQHRITDLVLCVGHLADKIQDHFGDGRHLGVRITYSIEKGRLLGTGGALRNAEPYLDEEFMLMYGDSYLLLDYREIAARFRSHGKLGLMVAYRNLDLYDRSNLVIRGDLVTRYNKKQRDPEMIYIDQGLSVLKKSTLSLLPNGGEVAPLEDLFCRLIEQRQLAAYETRQRFYEIGSTPGLEEFRTLIQSGEIPNDSDENAS